MYIISFNIMYKDERKIILTETPYLYVNESLRVIITEIRKVIKEDFVNLANQMNIPASTLALGITTFSTNESIMHFFEIEAFGVRELKEALFDQI